MKDRVGEKHITNEGYEVEIIEYFNNINSTIQFEDGTIRYNIKYNNIQRGKIKNPFHKSVYNVGYLGVGIHKVFIEGNTTKIYTTWKNMLKRCYQLKQLEKDSSYKECLVSEKWHNFQVFGEWYENNYKPKTMQGWQLDKDILVKGNKIYSPETCCFVPQEINLLIVKSNSTRGKYPIGVTKLGHKFRAEFNINDKTIHLGVFDTIEEAFQAYKTAKENQIKCVANEWKDRITEPTYQALYNYKVEITD